MSKSETFNYFDGRAKQPLRVGDPNGTVVAELEEATPEAIHDALLDVFSTTRADTLAYNPGATCYIDPPEHLYPRAPTVEEAQEAYMAGEILELEFEQWLAIAFATSEER